MVSKANFADYITPCITPVFRAYIRYFPFAVVKKWMYERIVAPYLGWRRFTTVTTTYFGAKVEVNFPDTIQRRIYFFGTWEPRISRFFARTLSDGDSFVDVGANIGYYSLLAANAVGPSGRVFAVEASPSIFGKLKRNVAMNGFKNIELFNVAVSDKAGLLKIYLGPDANIGSTTTIGPLSSDHHLEAEIPASPLAAIIGEDRLLSARLIKIDVEGAEPQVIRGIAHLMHRFANETEWIIEISPEAICKSGESVDDLLAVFRSAGYKLYSIHNEYSIESYLSPSNKIPLKELVGTPTEQVDIVATKREILNR